jgi:hypothetical protein
MSKREENYEIYSLIYSKNGKFRARKRTYISEESVNEYEEISALKKVK